MQTQNGARIHTEFSPSRSERFILCPGSVNLLRRTPSRERTIYSDSGTVAHEILETGLATFCSTVEEAIASSIYCCEDFDVGFKNAIQEGLDFVWATMENINSIYDDAQLYTEMYVNPPVEAAPGQAAGWCDIAIHSASARTIWVMDYKHGVRAVRDAVDNSQAMQYAAGLLFGENDKVVINPENIDTVVLCIIQPNAFHTRGTKREAVFTVAQVKEYLDALNNIILDTLRPDAPLIPGYDQCMFCEARSVCPALESKVREIINPAITTYKDINMVTLPDPKTLDVNRLSYIKKSFDMLKLWIDGIDSHIVELERSGVDVPGWKLVEAEARREWYGDEQDRVNKLASLIGCKKDELYTTKAKPLTEVEKMLVGAYKARVGKSRKKQAAENAKQDFAYFTLKQSSGNLTLVPDEDPRPAANKAVSYFASFTNIMNHEDL